MRVEEAIILKIPQLSLRRKIERNITITGEEKRMVVESPSGSLEKLMKMKISLSPPVKATRKSKQDILGVLGPRNGRFLYLAITPMMTSCKSPLITTSCMESISLTILIILEYAVIKSPDIKANRRPRDWFQHSFLGNLNFVHVSCCVEEDSEKNDEVLDDGFDILD